MFIIARKHITPRRMLYRARITLESYASRSRIVLESYSNRNCNRPIKSGTGGFAAESRALRRYRSIAARCACSRRRAPSSNGAAAARRTVARRSAANASSVTFTAAVELTCIPCFGIASRGPSRTFCIHDIRQSSNGNQ